MGSQTHREARRPSFSACGRPESRQGDRVVWTQVCRCHACVVTCEGVAAVTPAISTIGPDFVLLLLVISGFRALYALRSQSRNPIDSGLLIPLPEAPGRIPAACHTPAPAYRLTDTANNMILIQPRVRVSELPARAGWEMTARPCTRAYIVPVRLLQHS